MILDADKMESWDSCRRKWKFEKNWELRRVTPIGTLYRALHKALTAKEANPEIAKDYVISEIERGVWTLYSKPYDQMKNISFLAELLAKILRPSGEPWKLHPVLNDWKPNSYLMADGLRLIRLVICDRWDDDRQSSELHSWRTAGDICVTGLPMTLRVLVIGSNRDGKRHSAWTKAQRHPVNKQLRFARKHSKADGFAGSWDSIWREESGVSAQAWLEQMSRDGVLKELAFDRPVKVPDKYQRERVLSDIQRIREEMEAAKGDFPMTRSACDNPLRGSCPFQCVCYAPGEITIEETGVFRKLSK